VSCGSTYSSTVGSVIGFVLARVENAGIEEMKEGVITGGGGKEMVELDVERAGWAGTGWLTGYFLLRARYRMHSAIS